ncbi:GNAT family N-acetyltransferase [Aliikangiella sp. IMCC44359]|uniref:GNAT family N-acetyltransferase n=1 Tax=Aliikangiella sp. IMCC44359 TaxID=3459125 RepID=UPI00403B3323
MELFATDRLCLRELTIEDAPFILKLVNEPSWIENIGDKNVHDIEGAKSYLLQGPIKSYQENGFGLYLIELKKGHTPIGLCGLVKRKEFDSPDIGYALIPEFWGLGLASEAAKATLNYAKQKLNIERVLGLTSLGNAGSIKVLERIGLKYEKTVELPGYNGASRLFVPA